MDRRRLILASGALIPAVLARDALAQTQLPPARPAPADDAPPVSQYGPPAYQAPQPYPAQGYPPQPGYQPPPPQGGYQDGGPRDGYGQPNMPAPPGARPTYANTQNAETYSREELVNSVSDFLGVTAEAAGSAIERIFRDNGRPTGYVAGEELAAAFTVGLRYGKGLLYMKERQPQQVFWQGPSVGFDIRANGSRVFTLCYNLQYPDAIYRRFPGVEGSAYLVAGMGVNYQRAEEIVLAPMRAGIGLGAGVNVGYLAYSRKRNWIPL